MEFFTEAVLVDAYTTKVDADGKIIRTSDLKIYDKTEAEQPVPKKIVPIPSKSQRLLRLSREIYFRLLNNFKNNKLFWAIEIANFSLAIYLIIKMKNRKINDINIKENVFFK